MAGVAPSRKMHAAPRRKYAVDLRSARALVGCGRRPRWPHRSAGIDRRSIRELTAHLLLAGWLLCQAVSANAAGPKVEHLPGQPKSAEPVRITADFKNLARPAELALQYQIVEPGKYIARNDPAYQTQWILVKLNDTGANGDSTAGDGVFSAELPPTLQKHRRLIRYRLWSAAEKKVIAPEPKDPQPNFAYFVSDGVPAWRGAINPKSSDPKLREAVTFSSEALQRVPVYHFISHKSSVEKVTWHEPSGFGGSSRHEYKYTGTMVYDGVVYDHVQFRARGGVWRHAMGKNMWKFNFLPGHRFQARDFYGEPYRVKWDKLNLGACIQQGDYGMRGEQGMFEAVGFRLFNLAGLAAPRTHWVHLRIVDEAEESPANQYDGDFWGLYLATEEVDEQFLKEHELPPGNLYKIEGWQAKTEFNGDPNVRNQADVNGFLRATMNREQPASWWLKNVDLPRYYDYRSILECIHHYDIDSGKNYFYYLNPESRQWIVIPWDIDLTWGDNMFGGGSEPFYRAGLLRHPAFKEQYRDRLAEIRDLLFNPEQVRLLLDEHAAMISDPKGGPSMVDADRAKWDYNPVLTSRYVDPSKAGAGRFYFANPRNTFRTMVRYMQGYAERRMTWIDRGLLNGYRPPEPPKIVPSGPLRLSEPTLKFRIESASANPKNGKVRCRLAEITDTNSPSFNPRVPRKYEINALWERESSNADTIELPSNLVLPGHTYRVRARAQAAGGRWSRWSDPAQFTAELK